MGREFRENFQTLLDAGAVFRVGAKQINVLLELIDL